MGAVELRPYNQLCKAAAKTSNLYLIDSLKNYCSQAFCAAISTPARLAVKFNPPCK